MAASVGRKEVRFVLPPWPCLSHRARRSGTRNAFPAGGAGSRVAPGLVEIRDQVGEDTPAAQIPDAGALDLLAHPHAPGAQDAAVGVVREAGVGRVHVMRGITVGEAGVGDAQGEGRRLQLAVAVGNAHGADVVPFGEQQLQGHLAVALEPVGPGFQLHALGGGGDAGGQQARPSTLPHSNRTPRAG